MEEREIALIRGPCRDYICCECRTKFGWKHQLWCVQSDLEDPTCADCGYYNHKKNRCAHPTHGKKGRSQLNEKNQFTV